METSVDSNGEPSACLMGDVVGVFLVGDPGGVSLNADPGGDVVPGWNLKYKVDQLQVQ